VHAEESASKPEAGTDEAESLSRLPLAAIATIGNTSPVKRAAAVDLVDPVDKNTKGSEPCSAEEEVKWVVQEVEGEGQKPDQAEEGGDGGDNFRVDLTADRTIVTIVAVLMDEVAHNTKDHGSANEL